MKRILFCITVAMSLCFFVFSPLAAGDVFSRSISINEQKIFVRKGFDLSFVNPSDFSSREWIKSVNTRTLLVKDLFPIGPWKIIQADESEEFTIVVLVDLIGLSQTEKSMFLELSSIGENWTIYINGRVVKSSMFLDRSGNILMKRNVRGLTLEIPGTVLKDGKNTICFHVLGNPVSLSTGILKGEIGHYAHNIQWNEIAGMTLSAGFFVACIFSFVFCFERKKNLSLISVGIVLFLAGLNSLFSTLFVYNVIENTSVIDHSRDLSLFLIVPFLSMIIDSRGKFFVRFFGAFLGGTVFLFVITRVFYVNQPFPLVSILLLPLLVKIIMSFREYLSDGKTDLKNFIFPKVFIILVCSLTLVLMEIVFHDISLYQILPIGHFVLFLTLSFFVCSHIRGKIYRLEFMESSFLQMAGRLEESDMNMKAVSIKLNDALNDIDKKNKLFSAAGNELDFYKKENSIVGRKIAEIRSECFQNHFVNAAWDIAFFCKPSDSGWVSICDIYAEGETFSGMSFFEAAGEGLLPAAEILGLKSVASKRFAETLLRPGAGGLNRVMHRIGSDLKSAGKKSLFSGLLMKFTGDRVEYINASHPDVLFRNSLNGNVRVVGPSVPYKGPTLGDSNNESDYKVLSFELDKNDMVFVHSGVFLKMKNARGESYSAEMLKDSLSKANCSSAENAINSIISAFYAFVGDVSQDGDLAAILFMKK